MCNKRQDRHQEVPPIDPDDKKIPKEDNLSDRNRFKEDPKEYFEIFVTIC